MMSARLTIGPPPTFPLSLIIMAAGAQVYRTRETL